MLMKSGVNWMIFLILLTASIASSIAVLPFVLAISPDLQNVFTPTILLAQIVQSLIVFSIAIAIGLFLAGRVGFALPILKGLLQDKTPPGHFKSIIGLSIGMGILAAALVIVFSFLFWDTSLTLLNVEMSVATWKALLATFYGGIAEEVLCRLFLMTLLVWISTLIRKTPEGRPTNIGVWVGIVLSSILFGFGHLPITGDIVALSPAVVVRAVLLNTAAGIVFGWLYYRYGLESAMVSHFTCDIVLHVVTPLAASLFV
jgi:membrane protease YdiL (CAAX protease family)